jgi:hypothetical protein
VRDYLADTLPGLANSLLYTGNRYGLRDRVTQLVLALAGPITAGGYCWGQPALLAVWMALGICVQAVSIIGREYRNASIVPLVAGVTGFGSWMLLCFWPPNINAICNQAS